jgi:hypothetical protein
LRPARGSNQEGKHFESRGIFIALKYGVEVTESSTIKLGNTYHENSKFIFGSACSLQDEAGAVLTSQWQCRCGDTAFDLRRSVGRRTTLDSQIYWFKILQTQSIAQ